MKKNVIALPAVRAAGNLPAIRDIDDQDLLVRFVENHPGHIKRRADRKAARERVIRKAQEDRDQQMRDLAMVSQFTTLLVVVTMGLGLT